MEITGTIKQVNNIDGTVAATRQTIGSTNYSPIRWVDGEEVAPLIEPVVREVIEEVGIDSTAVRNQSTVSGTTVTDALNTLKNSTPDNLLTDDILNSSDVDGETATYALNQLNTDISTLSSTVGEHTTEIAGLDGDLQDLTGVVNGNTASINQLNQSLTNVVNDSTWKELVTGVSSVYIKDLQWQEIRVILLADNNPNFVYEFTLTKKIVEQSGNAYRFYETGGANNTIKLGVSNEWVTINTVIISGATYTDTSKIYAVYR